MKVHQNHLYIVTDVNSEHGIQIFDLTRLRNIDDFTVFSDDGRYHGVSGAHNLAINEETGFAYAG